MPDIHQKQHIEMCRRNEKTAIFKVITHMKKDFFNKKVSYRQIQNVNRITSGYEKI